MTIKILGGGCPNCMRLEKNVRQALKELNITAEVIAIKDMPSIMAYGVMSTPALVIDEKVMFNGRVPGSQDIKSYLT